MTLSEEYYVYPADDYSKKLTVGDRLRAYKLAQHHANKSKRTWIVKKAGATSYRIFNPA